MELVPKLQGFADALTKLGIVGSSDESINGQTARRILVFGWHRLERFYADLGQFVASKDRGCKEYFWQGYNGGYDFGRACHFARTRAFS